MNRSVPPLRLAEMLVVATEGTSDADPKTYKQAMKQPHAVLWREACQAEFDSLVDNKVFSVVDRQYFSDFMQATVAMLTVNSVTDFFEFSLNFIF